MIEAIGAVLILLVGLAIYFIPRGGASETREPSSY